MEILAAVLGAILAAILAFIVYAFQDDVKRWLSARRPVRGRITSLSDILGIEPDVRRLLASERSRSSKEFFAIGQCIELCRSPDLKRGWIENMMSFAIDSEPFVLRYGFQKLCDEWKRNNPQNPDKIRYILTQISGQNTSDAPFIQFHFKKSTFGRIFPIQSSLDKSVEIEPDSYGIPRQRYANKLLSLSDSAIPNFLVFHILVRTGDGYIVLVQRAQDADYYPNCWSASCEEQLSEEDFEKPNPFVGGVHRGLEEELGIPIEQNQMRIRLLSVLLEYDNLNTACCVAVDVPLVSEEVKQSWVELAPDRKEASRVAFIGSEFETLVRVLESGSISVGGKQIPEDSWHPTTKYRLCMFCASEYGLTALHRALIRERQKRQFANIRTTRRAG